MFKARLGLLETLSQKERAGTLAQMGKWLSHKLKDLSLIPEQPWEKVKCSSEPCNPSSEEKTRSPLGLAGQPV